MVIGDVKDIPAVLLAGEVEETLGGLWVGLLYPLNLPR